MTMSDYPTDPGDFLRRQEAKWIAFARDIEAWEAALILDAASWVDGLPRWSQGSYDRWLELQADRNMLLYGTTNPSKVTP
jgi:hypothetical protein